MPRITLCAFADEAATDFEGQIEALLQNGIPYIELRNLDGKNIADLSVTQAAAYKKRLDGAGLRVWSIGSPIGKSEITEPLEALEARLRHICELATVFGADKLRIFSFFNARGQKHEVLARLGRMVEIARGFGVALYHENEKDIFGDTVSRVQTLLDGVPGLCQVFDPANFLQVGERAADALAALFHRAGYFHIKDVIAADGVLVPAGCGDGEIPALVAGITGDTVLTLEPHLKVFDGYAGIDGTEMKHKFHFPTNRAAFDAAVQALEGILQACGYQKSERSFCK